MAALQLITPRDIPRLDGATCQHCRRHFLKAKMAVFEAGHIKARVKMFASHWAMLPHVAAALPSLQVEIAVLKLIASRDRGLHGTTVTCCHCPPFLQAEMAVLKLKQQFEADHIK
eukprot:5206291-Karenia_brevis.AAC.1